MTQHENRASWIRYWSDLLTFGISEFSVLATLLKAQCRTTYNIKMYLCSNAKLRMQLLASPPLCDLSALLGISGSPNLANGSNGSGQGDCVTVMSHKYQ